MAKLIQEVFNAEKYLDTNKSDPDFIRFSSHNILFVAFLPILHLNMELMITNYLKQISPESFSTKLIYSCRYYLFLGLSFFSLTVAHAQTRNVKGKVQASQDNAPLAGVSISVKGTSNGTSTDENGAYSITYTGDSAVLVFSYLGFVEKEVPVIGSLNQDILLDEDSKQLDEVTIIGSRNANRTKVESPVPVDVIDFKPLLESAPQVTVTQILQFVAPSFNSTPTSGGDASAGVNAAQLRGLSVDHVLVLVNGKRRYKSALVNLGGNGAGSVGTDLNAIPTGSIERIEILRDGASAQYGSDAIAGVINIVLKKTTDELNASATTGVLYLGDGVTTRANANYGFKLGTKGYANVTGEFGTRGITSTAGEYQNQIYGPGGGASDYNAVYTREMDEAIMAKQGKTRRDFNLRSAPHKQQDGLASFNIGIPLQRGAEVYMFGGMSFRRTENTGVYRYPGQDRNISQITPDGYLPQIVMGIHDRSLTAGIRGEINKWKVDFYNAFGKNDFRIRVENSFNVTLGLSSPRTFDAGSFNSSMNTTGLELSRLFPNVLNGLNIAYGAQYRVETYNVVAGEDASTANYGFRSRFNVDTTAAGLQYIQPSPTIAPIALAPGSQVFPGFSQRDAVKAFRANAAAYLDTELELTNAWLVSAAVRGESYTDFGEVITGKVATRYKLINALSIRGSASTGFRAPDLAQTYFTQVSTNFFNGQATDVLIASNVSAAARALGIPKLKQERSESYTLGITSQPMPRMEITFDAYNVDVRDRIVITGRFASTNTTIPEDLRAALTATGSTEASFFFNAVKTRTQGIEGTFSYKLPLGPGDFSIVMAGNLSRTMLREVNTPPLLRGQEKVVISEIEKARLTTQVPQQKHSIMGIYSIGKFTSMLRTVYFGKSTVASQAGTGFHYQTFDPIWITDVSIGYRIVPQLLITIGANNVFDIYPEKVGDADPVINRNLTAAGRTVYNGSVQNGSLGGFAFVRLSATIK